MELVRINCFGVLKSALRNPKSAMLAAALVFALSFSAHAQQQPKKIPRIGLLLSLPAAFTVRPNPAFVRELRKLGYVEGQSITFEVRNSEGNTERFPDLAADLVRLKGLGKMRGDEVSALNTSNHTQKEDPLCCSEKALY